MNECLKHYCCNILVYLNTTVLKSTILELIFRVSFKNHFQLLTVQLQSSPSEHQLNEREFVIQCEQLVSQKEHLQGEGRRSSKAHIPFRNVCLVLLSTILQKIDAVSVSLKTLNLLGNLSLFNDHGSQFLSMNRVDCWCRSPTWT